MSKNWYELAEPDLIESPSLLVFPHRVEANIERAIKLAGDSQRMRPHVKTHKLAQVAQMHQKHNINKAKCATIAEAEMLAGAGVADVLLAHQPVGPNQARLVALVAAYPATQFGCIVDNEATARQIDAKMADSSGKLNVWIDIDNGTRRSGIAPGNSAESLAKQLSDASNLTFRGLHVYDGHFANLAIDDRIEASDQAFEPVREMIERLSAENVQIDNIVAGGSPTFPVHAMRREVDLSPGTYVFWDAGYGSLCPELPFEPAAILLTRVISKLDDKRFCLDLGSKAVSPDNPVHNRVRLIGFPEAEFIGQSEEHLIVELPDASNVQVGDAFYGVPWHICPTVALHMEAIVIDESGEETDRWEILSRARRLTI